MIRSIAKRWRELSGLNNWENLLDPLDIDLRRYIIHYGERAQACYDTFVREGKSKYAGSSKYSKSNLFTRVGLENGNPYKYKVVKYFYATSQMPVPATFILKSISRESWCKESNWMGYIAVATDEGKVALGRRDILIAWRGSVEALEWADDFNFPLTSASKILGEGSGAKVHRGWFSIYTSDDPKSPFNKTSARDQVLPQVQQLIENYKDEEISITVTGHSLGAALATLNAVDIATNGFNKSRSQPNKPCPITVFVFACPRVGDSHFRDIFQSTKNLNILRISNVSDYVTLLPPFVGYVEVGQQLLIDSRKSNYIKHNTDYFGRTHNLEAAYLHGVAGTHGEDGDFRLEVERDIALVNKFTDLVKDEYLVPGYWWVEKNMGMVQKGDGSWDLEDHENDDEIPNPTPNFNQCVLH